MPHGLPGGWPRPRGAWDADPLDRRYGWGDGGAVEGGGWSGSAADAGLLGSAYGALRHGIEAGGALRAAIGRNGPSSSAVAALSSHGHHPGARGTTGAWGGVAMHLPPGDLLQGYDARSTDHVNARRIEADNFHNLLQARLQKDRASGKGSWLDGSADPAADWQAARRAAGLAPAPVGITTWRQHAREQDDHGTGTRMPRHSALGRSAYSAGARQQFRASSLLQSQATAADAAYAGESTATRRRVAADTDAAGPGTGTIHMQYRSAPLLPPGSSDKLMRAALSPRGPALALEPTASVSNAQSAEHGRNPSEDTS